MRSFVRWPGAAATANAVVALWPGIERTKVSIGRTAVAERGRERVDGSPNREQCLLAVHGAAGRSVRPLVGRIDGWLVVGSGLSVCMASMLHVSCSISPCVCVVDRHT